MVIWQEKKIVILDFIPKYYNNTVRILATELSSFFSRFCCLRFLLLLRSKVFQGVER